MCADSGVWLILLWIFLFCFVFICEVPQGLHGKEKI